MMWFISRSRWCSWAPQHSQRPWARVSTLYFTEPLIGLLAEGIEAQAAQLLQVVAENEAVGVVVVGGDDVSGEHLAHQ